MTGPGSVTERRWQRRETARDVRRLPVGLQRLVSSIRVPMVLAGVIETIEQDVEAEAVRRGLVRMKHERGDLNELDRREVVEHLAGQEDYRRRVTNLVNSACRNAHLEWVRRSDGETTSEGVSRVEMPLSGPWSAGADVGLGTAAYLEAMPDEVALAIVSMLAHDITNAEIDSFLDNAACAA